MKGPTEHLVVGTVYILSPTMYALCRDPIMRKAPFGKEVVPGWPLDEHRGPLLAAGCWWFPSRDNASSGDVPPPVHRRRPTTCSMKNAFVVFRLPSPLRDLETNARRYRGAPSPRTRFRRSSLYSPDCRKT